jgi:hypothetical protein
LLVDVRFAVTTSQNEKGEECVEFDPFFVFWRYESFAEWVLCYVFFQFPRESKWREKLRRFSENNGWKIALFTFHEKELLSLRCSLFAVLFSNVILKLKVKLQQLFNFIAFHPPESRLRTPARRIIAVSAAERTAKSFKRRLDDESELALTLASHSPSINMLYDSAHERQTRLQLCNNR